MITNCVLLWGQNRCRKPGRPGFSPLLSIILSHHVAFLGLSFPSVKSGIAWNDVPQHLFLHSPIKNNEEVLLLAEETKMKTTAPAFKCPAAW